MPCDYKKYPKDWKAIRARILERDKNCCKFCGLANKAIICRSHEDPSRYLLLKDDTYYFNDRPVRLSEIPSEFISDRPDTQVVLTVAHLDHDINHNDDDNLAALCQRCHLKHDARLHAQHARETRIQRSGQMRMEI